MSTFRNGRPEDLDPKNYEMPPWLERVGKRSVLEEMVFKLEVESQKYPQYRVAGPKELPPLSPRIP